MIERLLNSVRKSLQDPEERKDFEEWYFKKYGKPYEWKRQTTQEE